ncbi:MAG: hypothetical protein RMJ56_10895 [Gemmataceae bacterium]|nr:hypothetical protein [Gemmata sp.]MDW8198096.1 hypothetical protein [Gemmataceae bacterium]
MANDVRVAAAGKPSCGNFLLPIVFRHRRRGLGLSTANGPVRIFGDELLFFGTSCLCVGRCGSAVEGHFATVDDGMRRVVGRTLPQRLSGGIVRRLT